MLINELPIMMCKCLILTIIIEVLISLFIKVRDKKDFFNIILVNIMTNPLVTSITTFINLQYGLFERKVSLIVLEIFAVLSEGYVYSKVLKFNKINPYILSIILNMSSYFIGEIINMI